MDWLSELFKNAPLNEVTTLAGLINLFGMAWLSRLTTTVSVTEFVLRLLLVSWEGSRKYRAGKRGFKYEPVIRDRRPRPQRYGKLKNSVLVLMAVIVCMAAITVVDKVSAPAA